MSSTDDLLTMAKLRVRKISSDALDEDIRQHIDFVLADLERIGVHPSWLAKPDALIKEAVLVYCKANYAKTVDDKLTNSYNIILSKIKGRLKYSKVRANNE